MNFFIALLLFFNPPNGKLYLDWQANDENHSGLSVRNKL